MIRLDPISLAHARAVQVLASDPLIAATSNVPHPYPADGAAAWIRYTRAQRELGHELNFAILDEAPLASRRPPTLVGVCGVLNITGTPRRGELGYWIGVPYWNRGFASAAARELVRLVFEEHGIERLHSSCLVRNLASFRVLEKTGFRQTGFGLHPSAKWGPQDRFALFELTQEEWRASGASRVAHSNAQLPTPNAQGPTANAQLPTPNAQGSNSNSQLPTPNSQGLTANSQLPTPNSQGSNSNSQLPTSNSQGPPATSQQATRGGRLAADRRLHPTKVGD